MQMSNHSNRLQPGPYPIKALKEGQDDFPVYGFDNKISKILFKTRTPFINTDLFCSVWLVLWQWKNKLKCGLSLNNLETNHNGCSTMRLLSSSIYQIWNESFWGYSSGKFHRFGNFFLSVGVNPTLKACFILNLQMV